MNTRIPSISTILQSNSSGRKINEFEKMMLRDLARKVMQTAERDPKQTLTALYGWNTIDSLSAFQLIDFIERARAKTLWSDTRLRNCLKTFNYGRNR